jgi:hypothetical protein
MVGDDAGRQAILFISRASADKELAEEIGKILKGADYSVILQEWNMRNRNFIQVMHDALRESDHVIALLSPAYMQSEHCEAEWQNAIASDPLNKRGRLIVLRAENCEPEGMLKALAYWDLLPSRGDLASLRDVVLQAVRTDPGRCGAEALPHFRRAALMALSSEKIVHHKVQEVPGFTGRDAELEALDAALWMRGGTAALTNSKSSSSSAAVRGLGGVGKTTLAREYASLAQDKYCGVWWLEAEKRGGRLDQLVTGLIELGEKLIPGIEDLPDREKSARAVLEFIEDGRSDKPWLLVYDNVENPRDMDEWRPRRNAHVLITTRWPHWEGEAAPLPIDVFTPEVAVDFLMAHKSGTEQASKKMRAAAADLASKLGHLPLALDHARSYCKRTGRSFEAYGDELPELIKKVPPGVVYPNAVFATFELAMRKASEGCPEAEILMSMAAFMAPDRIPLSVVTPDIMNSSKRDDAVAALTGVSLIKVSDETIGMHRLVQEVARSRQTPETRARSLDSLAKAIAAVYPKDPWGLFPHVLEVLQVLSKDEYQDFAARDFVDRLTRVVIMGLRTAAGHQEGGKVIPEHIATLIGDFYEVDPLKNAIALLLSDYRYAWPKIRKQLLAKNSYALRYAMAISLADACCQEPPLITLEEIADLIGEDKDLNEFELGAYALTLVYARKPDLIYAGGPNPAAVKNLRKLAERPEMLGWSIVGDFLLNLMFRNDIPRGVHPHELVTIEKFWNPIWDLIKLDVCGIQAAEAFNATPRRVISEVPADARDAFKNLEAVESLLKEMRQSPRNGAAVRALLDDYFSLGQHIARVHDIQDELAKKSNTEVKEFLCLLFRHPLWAVAEATATLLSMLAEKDRRRLRLISDLFEETESRVNYGASAAAYYVRHIDNAELFFQSLKKFHTHSNPWVRGIGIEHLSAHILSASAAKRDELLAQFKNIIQYWLSTEEDCWGLDHLHRLFNTLDSREVEIAWLFPSNISPLLMGKPKWYEMERGEFLLHIEDRKGELLKERKKKQAAEIPLPLSRIARRVWASVRFH